MRKKTAWTIILICSLVAIVFRILIIAGSKL